MSLQIVAELSEQSVTELLSELLPVTIDLDPRGDDSGRRWLRIAEPRHVDFVPDLGLRVRTSAALQWTALGVAVPATVREIELLLRPVVTTDQRGPKLVFRPSIESADFKLMPALVDQAITNRINAALIAEGDLPGWHFGESLGQRVPLPPSLEPVDAFHLGAGDLSVSVHQHGIVLKLGITMRFSRDRAPTAGREAASSERSG